MKRPRGEPYDLLKLAADPHPPLTREEEGRLARAFRRGDRQARERLVLSNLRFVLKIAGQFGHDLPLPDRFQEGVLGLMRAIETFQPRRGRFLTYAVWWIRAYIREAIRRSRSGGFTPLRNRISPPPHAEPLDGSGDEEERTPAELLAFEGADPEELSSLEERARRVRGALRVLDERELRILEQRSLAPDVRPLARIGEEMSLSHERVRQLEARAFAKLRAVLREAA